MDASKLSSYGGTGVPEALCKAADPREMFAEACRYVAQGVSLAKLAKFNLRRSEYFYAVAWGVAAKDCKHFLTVKYFSESSVFYFLSFSCITGTVHFLAQAQLQRLRQFLNGVRQEKLETMV